MTANAKNRPNTTIAHGRNGNTENEKAASEVSAVKSWREQELSLIHISDFQTLLPEFHLSYLKTHISPRYLDNIETKGQHPSLQIFYELVARYNISVDQFFFPDNEAEKSTQRRQLDKILDNMSEDVYKRQALIVSKSLDNTADRTCK